MSYQSSLPFWTPEREQVLRALWCVGKSGSEVAAAIGCGLTRSAVMGKIHRLGIQRSPEVAAASRLGKTTNKPPKPLKISKPSKVRVREANERRKTYRQEAASLAAVNVSSIPPKTLIDLGCKECRWPVSTPKEGQGYQTLFCADVALNGKPYCAAHYLASSEPVNVYDRRVRTADKSIRVVSVKEPLDASEIGLDGIAA